MYVKGYIIGQMVSDFHVKDLIIGSFGMKRTILFDHFFNWSLHLCKDLSIGQFLLLLELYAKTMVLVHFSMFLEMFLKAHIRSCLQMIFDLFVKCHIIGSFHQFHFICTLLYCLSNWYLSILYVKALIFGSFFIKWASFHLFLQAGVFFFQFCRNHMLKSRFATHLQVKGYTSCSILLHKL